MAYKFLVCILTILSIASEITNASHFRGGTISWRPLSGTKVEFSFKMGWTYGKGPGCEETLVGQFVNQLTGGDHWECQIGCPGNDVLAPLDYYCMAANQQEGWEQGQNTFEYTLPGKGPFTVGYESTAWAPLAGGKGNGNYRLATEIDLRTRSDTGRSNSSPYTLSKPLYYMQYDCSHVLKLPVLDPDGDNIRCRWAVGNECKTVCNALPNAVLDEETCTLTFTSDNANNYIDGGEYAVALTIEDYPKATIKLDGTTSKTPTDALSSIPLQFLIKTPSYPHPCDSKPRFVKPTPLENHVITAEEGDVLNIPLFADHDKDTTVKITKIQVIGPRQASQTPLVKHPTKVNTYVSNITWATTAADVGEHLVCATAESEQLISGDPRCFVIKIVDKPCKSSPCKNGGACTNQIGNYKCACSVGFTGHSCETDIDDCKPDPCQNGATCIDHFNNYTCICPPGYTDKNCQTDIDDCASGPCKNGATCIDKVAAFTCHCPPGFIGTLCQFGFDFCASGPCQNGGICVNNVTGYICNCFDGWKGATCDYRNTKPGQTIPPHPGQTVPPFPGQTVPPVPGQTVPPNPGNPVTIVNKTIGIKPNPADPYGITNLVAPSSCPLMEYSHCKCVVSPSVHHAASGLRRIERDMLAGFIGSMLGLVLSFATFYCLKYCFLRCCVSSSYHRRTKPLPEQTKPMAEETKPMPDRTKQWVDESGHLPPVESPQTKPVVPEASVDGSSAASTKATTRVTNIYRATFVDTNLHSTAKKKDAGTYSSGAMDWN